MAAGAKLLDSRPARFMAWFALVLTLATDAAYVLLKLTQGNASLDVYTVVFVAGYLVLLATLLVISLMRLGTVDWRMPLRAAASAGLLVLGVIAIFSIGVPLVIAGAMATGATVRTLRGPFLTASSVSAVAAAVLAVVVLVAGFEGTQRLIVCPDHGTVTGGGNGFVSGPYYYECVNGRLNMHAGSCSSASVDANGNVTRPGC
ncbi:MAG: hypothetical protein ACYDAL_18145 [Candidatus Dormibacteraceae bacterium]